METTGTSRATPRRALRAAGAWLLAGSLMWWVAAVLLIPDEDFFFEDSAREEALAIAEHTGAFRGFHLVAAAGTAAAAIGVVLVGRALRANRPSRLADAAAAMAGVGLVAWLVEVTLRMTAGVARAEDVAAGLREPPAEPAIGNAVIFAVSALAFAAPAVSGWALAGRRLPGRIASIAAAALVTAAAIVAAATLAPSVVFQFGVGALALVLLLYRSARFAVAAASA